MSATRTRAGSERIRGQLIASATELFHAHGYNATGVKDITDGAGVPKGSFYNHFGSKQDIAVVALNHYAAQSPIGLLMEPNRLPLARLRDHFDELARRFEESDYQRGCMLGNFADEIADHSEAVRSTLVGLFSAWKAAITAVIAEAHENDRPKLAPPPDQLADVILSTWEGAVTRTRTSNSGEHIAAFFATVFGYLLAPAEPS